MEIFEILYLKKSDLKRTNSFFHFVNNKGLNLDKDTKLDNLSNSLFRKLLELIFFAVVSGEGSLTFSFVEQKLRSFRLHSAYELLCQNIAERESGVYFSKIWVKLWARIDVRLKANFFCNTQNSDFFDTLYMVFNLCPFVMKFKETVEKEAVEHEEELVNVKDILKFAFAKLNKIELPGSLVTAKRKTGLNSKRKSIWARRQSRFPGIELKTENKKSIFTGELPALKRRVSVYQVSKSPLEDLDKGRNLKIRESLNSRSSERKSRYPAPNSRKTLNFYMEDNSGSNSFLIAERLHLKFRSGRRTGLMPGLNGKPTLKPKAKAKSKSKGLFLEALKFLKGTVDIDKMADLDFLNKLFPSNFFEQLDTAESNWKLKLDILGKNPFTASCEKVRLFYLCSFEMRIKLILNCFNEKTQAFLVGLTR